jgi:hypothetical protein
MNVILHAGFENLNLSSLKEFQLKILMYSKWDAVPVVCGALHFAFVVTFFLVFPHAPLWLLICMGLIYSMSVSWNINGISHNQIHNP